MLLLVHVTCYFQLVVSAREDAVADALSAALDRSTVQLFNSEEVGSVTLPCNMLFSAFEGGAGGCIICALSALCSCDVSPYSLSVVLRRVTFCYVTCHFQLVL
jgi:hypothetical protein